MTYLRGDIVIEMSCVLGIAKFGSIWCRVLVDVVPIDPFEPRMSLFHKA